MILIQYWIGGVKMPRGIPKVISRVPLDYIYYDCPFCNKINNIGDTEGIVECEHCKRKVEITGNDW